MTMNCERIEAALLAVVDGRATREERERVAEHVAACAACARQAEEMRAVWSGLDRLPELEPSPSFDARLRARLAEEQNRPRLFAWMAGNMRLVAVVAALVAVAAWFSLRPVAQRPAPQAAAQSQEDFSVVKNLPVLENYDVVSNLDVLSDLPGAEQHTSAAPQPQPME
jgi:anti-sigma factor RsiW